MCAKSRTFNIAEWVRVIQDFGGFANKTLLFIVVVVVVVVVQCYFCEFWAIKNIGLKVFRSPLRWAYG